MGFWWVFQGESYKRALDGGYLWAPKVGARGQRQAYWTNMTRVRAGDVIFSGYGQELVAVSTAIEPAYDADPPDSRDVGKWPARGWKLDVAYVQLSRPLPYSGFVSKIMPLLQPPHAPFNANTGKGNLGYLFELPTSAGETLLSLLDEPTLIDQAIRMGGTKRSPLSEITRKALVDARVGQGDFRRDLETYWDKRCAVGSVSTPQLLRASHIKTWSSSNNQQRLDPFNGLLLSVGYDAAFDRLLITFDDDGQLILASDLPLEDAYSIGIDPASRLRQIDPRHRPYLSEHRAQFASRVAKAKLSNGKTSTN